MALEHHPIFAGVWRAGHRDRDTGTAAPVCGMVVNGVVRYPESLSGSLGMLTVNGTSVCYPDDAIVLKNNAVIDRLFALRAKQRLYWTNKRMIMVDSQLEPEALKAKGAGFCAREVILAQSLAEGMIDLIDEQADSYVM